MSADRSSVTVAEIDAALVATMSSRNFNGKNKVVSLGVIKTPTLNNMRGAGGAKSTPVQGAYKCQMKGLRGGRLQTYSGRDIMTFASVDTLFDIEYAIGKVHLGDEWVHQQLEEAGLQIDLSDANKGRVDIKNLSSDAQEVLLNLADEKLDSLETNFRLELNKMLWRANTSDPKAFVGINGLLNNVTNTSGPVGNRNRSNALLRHQLRTSIAAADIELNLSQIARAANKRVQDGSGVSVLTCGETLYDAIFEKFVTGSTGVSAGGGGATTIRRNMDEENRIKKLEIGFPDNAIYLNGVGMVMIEPVFEELDREDSPAVLYQKSLWGFNMDHLKFKPTKGKDGALKIHEPPYNQAVTRISMYGEYALVADQYDCHFVLTAA